jgi:hypothetical protein
VAPPNRPIAAGDPRIDSAANDYNSRYSKQELADVAELPLALATIADGADSCSREVSNSPIRGAYKAANN